MVRGVVGCSQRTAVTVACKRRLVLRWRGPLTDGLYGCGLPLLVSVVAFVGGGSCWLVGGWLYWVLMEHRKVSHSVIVGI